MTDPKARLSRSSIISPVKESIFTNDNDDIVFEMQTARLLGRTDESPSFGPAQNISVQAPLSLANGQLGFDPAAGMEGFVDLNAWFNGLQYTRSINYSYQDLNDLVYSGFYDGAGMTHAPNDGAGWYYVIVQRHSNPANTYVLQFAYELAVNPPSFGFYRICRDGWWDAWNRYALRSEIDYLQGEIDTITDTTVPALQSADSGLQGQIEAVIANLSLVHLGTTTGADVAYIQNTAAFAAANDGYTGTLIFWNWWDRGAMYSHPLNARVSYDGINFVTTNTYWGGGYTDRFPIVSGSNDGATGFTWVFPAAANQTWCSLYLGGGSETDWGCSGGHSGTGSTRIRGLRLLSDTNIDATMRVYGLKAS